MRCEYAAAIVFVELFLVLYYILFVFKDSVFLVYFFYYLGLLFLLLILMYFQDFITCIFYILKARKLFVWFPEDFGLVFGDDKVTYLSEMTFYNKAKQLILSLMQTYLILLFFLIELKYLFLH